jgi:hypothetical protein
MRHAITAATSLALLCTAPLYAHHSGAMWDTSKTMTVSGTVKEFQWTNPHCWIQLMVPVSDAADSPVEEWSIEMASPIQVLQGGWKPATLKAGDRIQVTLHPARDGRRAGNFVSAVAADGRSLGKNQEPHP